MRRMLFLCCSLVVLNAYSQAIDEPYDYPIRPGTEAWKQFHTQKEMMDACMIPENILKNLTTKTLVETGLDYPILTSWKKDRKA